MQETNILCRDNRLTDALKSMIPKVIYDPMFPGRTTGAGDIRAYLPSISPVGHRYFAMIR